MARDQKYEILPPRSLDDVETVVWGDSPRHELAQQILNNLTQISEKAVSLLTSFMRDSGTFGLSSVNVFPGRTEEHGDFVLRYSFTADRDQYEYGYTYFDVVFWYDDPPASNFRPSKFIVGFH